ncbi:MAG: threonylcarbamoyl-AMP synthase [Clostridia bacterium]|nr:threonylcarbamoyl-AMP synthase [Clostridia bacterium]
MQTEVAKILSVSEEKSQKALEKAGQIIRDGGLVVFPTETVYGLGADATNERATKSIFEAKGRPSDNPLIIHLYSVEDAEKYTYTNELYYRIADRFMPGPITVIMRAKDIIPRSVTAGLDTVAVRIPVHPVAREFIRLAGVPVAAPSANLSGSPSPTCFKYAFSDMNGRVDMIIDGGESEFGLESTIVKIEDENTLTLLRPGAITVEDLRDICPNVIISDAVLNALKEGERVLSPGMKYKHYAPKTEFFLLDGDLSVRFDYISKREGKIALLCYDEERARFESIIPSSFILSIGKKAEPKAQAKMLFTRLRDADALGADEIYAALPQLDGIGMALYNRMIRASGYKIIKL